MAGGILVYLAPSLFLGALGHLLVKEGVTRAGAWTAAFFQPLLILGVLCYFASMALWLPFLQSRPVAQAVPVAGLTYVLVALLSGLGRGEWLTLPQWGGVVLVAAGVWLLSYR
ncbi:MAG: EamA family transporter [Pelotomaculum sp.]|nr:EamA family transporter [Pelotomaculum sp.]